jgi:hypothetical protein
LRRLAARLAGAGIGDAGIDHQRANFLASRQMLAAKLDRRGAETILGEHTGHRATGIQRHQRQVAAIFLADFGFSNTEANTRHRKQLIRAGVA